MTQGNNDAYPNIDGHRIVGAMVKQTDANISVDVRTCPYMVFYALRCEYASKKPVDFVKIVVR